MKSHGVRLKKAVNGARGGQGRKGLAFQKCQDR